MRKPAIREERTPSGSVNSLRIAITGIAGTNTQHLAVQESRGSIVDRSREHLGSTDKAIIAFRRILLDLITALQKGNEPLGADPTTYRRVRPADLVMPKDVAWQEGTKNKLIAHW